MSAKLDFYIAAEPDIGLLSNQLKVKDYDGAALTLRKLSYLAESLQISDFPSSQVTVFRGGPHRDLSEHNRRIIAARFDVEDHFNRIYAENIKTLNPELKKNEVVILDEPWRQKITSYISHIRAVLHGEDIEKRIYQSIMNKLNDLQEMVDRHEARVDAAQEIFLDLTRTAAQGTKNLEPVTGLAKKMWLAIERLFGSDGEQPRQLPPPETLGLPDPDEQD